MNEVIAIAHAPLREGTTPVEVVDARELHAKLGVGRHFSSWIQDRISKYGFIERQDFFTSCEKVAMGRPRLDYTITIDMAKQLCMLEANTQAKAIRQYLIDRDNRLTRIEQGTEAPPTPQFKVPTTMVEALELALQQTKALEHTKELLSTTQALEQQARTALASTSCELMVAAPKAEAFDQLMDSAGFFDIATAAKALDTTRDKLRNAMLAKGLIFRPYTSKGYAAKASAIGAGWFENKVSTYFLSTGKRVAYSKVMISPRGLEYLRKHVPLA